MLARPAPHGQAAFLQLGEGSLVDVRLGVDDVSGPMGPGPLDRRLRVETLVEDRSGDADERGSEAGPTGRTDRERGALVVDSEARGHHALHPAAGLQWADEQVDLAEHAVQV